jgi:hypothetical protein
MQNEYSLNGICSTVFFCPDMEKMNAGNRESSNSAVYLSLEQVGRSHRLHQFLINMRLEMPAKLIT